MSLEDTTQNNDTTSNTEETKTHPFNQRFSPPENYTPPEDTKIGALEDAQQRIVTGLAQAQATNHVANMQELAPLDEFTIGGIKYKRNKITRKVIREMRREVKKYLEEIKKIDDEELLLDRADQMLFYKANVYLGMTQDQFDETDYEMLQTVIQATELRTNGFRRIQHKS